MSGICQRPKCERLATLVVEHRHLCWVCAQALTPRVVRLMPVRPVVVGAA